MSGTGFVSPIEPPVPSGFKAFEPGANPAQIPSITRFGVIVSIFLFCSSSSSGVCQNLITTLPTSVAPERSSSKRYSGVPAATSSGTAATTRPRELLPPVAPTRSLIPSRGGVDSIATIARFGATVAVNRSSARTTGALPSIGVSRSRERPMMVRLASAPCGQTLSIVEVRRIDPSLRTGAATAGPFG
ncbi:unannotated protein [freshwater metagenome]|uniref:Unannotated protein n=1 Tax=freshwater metagenome TaxID=449393 RepID=A0A6J7SQ05_9ZZZZ